MSPKLLFLHGVGEPSPEAWQPALNEALAGTGFPVVTEDDVIEPQYRDLLTSDLVQKSNLPAAASLPKATLTQRRAMYEQSQASMRRLLGLETGTVRTVSNCPSDLADFVTGIATAIPGFVLQQARWYCEQEARRSAVIARVLASVDTERELVIVGHSLGSLVALDLLPYLHNYVRVRRLITIGSPLGIPRMHERSDRLLTKFPYGQVDSWLNVLSTRDFVTARRKLTSLFPAAVDLVITPEAKHEGATRHGAADYLREPGSGRAVGEAMSGTTNVPARVEVSLDVRPSDEEYVALFGLAFAHLVSKQLQRENSETGARYEAALSVVQLEIHRRLQETARNRSGTLSQAVDDLGNGAAPSIPRRWAADIDASVRLLTVTATTNIINPYEVEASRATLAVLPGSSVGLGFGLDVGDKVRDSLAEARRCFDTSWFTWQRMLIGSAGLALLAAGPIGLAIAAPAGLAGGAVITSALAAFGPGGMVGGMALAGALASSGAVAATAAALIDQPAAVLELEVVRRMTHALTRKKLDLPQDPTDWSLLVSTAHSLDQEIGRLGAFSDEKSESMKTLHSKQSMLAKALDWMAARSLTPPQLSA